MVSPVIPTDAALPAAQRDKTLPELLAEHARAHADRLFLQEADGPQLTYGAAYDRALRWANVLREVGIGPGARVATLAYRFSPTKGAL